MKKDNSQKKASKADLQNIDNFIQTNLHYLSADKQKLFQMIKGCEDIINKASYQVKRIKKSGYQGADYNGKS